LKGADPSLEVCPAPDGTVLIGASSDAQLEKVVDQLARRFDVEASVGRLEIAYKEALTHRAFGEAKYAKQSGGRGQYAHVKIEVRPTEPGSGFVFVNAIAGGAIPGEFVKPVAQALREACSRGVLAAYPIEDVHITLYDGSYHDVDSSVEAFRIAATLAFRDAAMHAQPVLLEPMMNVTVTSSVDDEEAMLRSLQSRHAVEASHAMRGNALRIFAIAPMSTMFGYASELRRRTDGRGSLSMEFSHYAPAALADGDGDRDAPVRQPKWPRRPPLILRVSVPEPPPDLPEPDLRRRS
jgi:elongation factor G